MSENPFSTKMLEIHMLQSYGPSNLNRDDTGSVKDAEFGGYRRARISSQCLKRALRTHETFSSHTGLTGVRTKFLPQKVLEVYKEIQKREPDAEFLRFVRILETVGGGTGSQKSSTSSTSQLYYVSPELPRYIVEHFDELKAQLREWDKSKEEKVIEKVNMWLREFERTLPLPSDIALFGRMTTDQPIEDIQAACQVAHALSVTEHKPDFDYFTAVDDLAHEFREDVGAGHIGETEFTSNIFYKYFAVDIELLYQHLMRGRKDPEEARAQVEITLRALLEASVYSNPSGKQNSFAQHTLPFFIAVTLKNKKIPLNCINAFLEPVRKPPLDKESVNRFVKYYDKARTTYGLPVTHTFAILDIGEEIELPQTIRRVSTLPELTESTLSSL